MSLMTNNLKFVYICTHTFCCQCETALKSLLEKIIFGIKVCCIIKQWQGIINSCLNLYVSS